MFSQLYPCSFHMIFIVYIFLMFIVHAIIYYPKMCEAQDYVSGNLSI